MATRFAVANGNFSNGATWDNGAVPTSADDVYANGFTVTINGTYTVLSIRNTIPTVSVPNIATPIMTSNTTPSGVVFASSTNGSNFPWNAFSQDGNVTQWASAVANTGILGYQFTSGKIIKRYIIRGSTNTASNPSTWTFQGSNDGTTYTTLDTVTASTIPASGNYTSSILANTTSYTYYRINITAVGTLGSQPIITEFEMTESTGTVLGNATGGQFIYANGGNLTCTATQAIFAGSTTPVLEMNLPSPNTAIFNGSVLTITNTANFIAIRNSNSGTLSCNGNYNIDAAASSRAIISHTSTGTTNIISSTISSTVTTGGAGAVVNMTGNGVVNITGDVSGSASSGTVGSSPILSNIGTLNITGNTTGASSAAVFLSGAVNYSQIGNVNASATQAAIYTNASATISVTGIITAGTGAPAIYSGIALSSGYGSSTFVKVSGNVVNTNNVMAIVAPRVTIDTATSSWLFQISTGGNRTLYAAGVALGNPIAANVRFGTVYGASNELTGTLIVPSPSNVLQGVGTDATVGTLLMTPQQFWDHLISTGFAANSIGDRLQNASTVATTGGQIASYNI